MKHFLTSKYRTPLRKMSTLAPSNVKATHHQRSSNKFMCVSVQLESDLFRNTSVCLCGCLSTFTSYKKRRQKEAARKRETAHLHSPCTHFPGLPCRKTEVIKRCQTDAHNVSTVGFCKPKIVETLICTLMQKLSDCNTAEIPLGLIQTLVCDPAGWF